MPQIECTRLNVQNVFDKVLAIAEEPPDNLVIPGLSRRSVGGILGAPGIGKSLLALEIAAYVSQGVSHLGWEALPTGPAVYFDGQNGKEEMKRRLYRIWQASPKKEDWKAEALRVVVSKGVSLFLDNALDAIIKTARGARLIVFDSLRSFHDQNDEDDLKMLLLLERLETIAEKTGASVLFTALDDPEYPDYISGSKVISDHIQFQINLSAESEKLIKLRYTKNRWFPSFESISLKAGEGGILERASYK